jgi:hypothetical protein
MPFIRASSTTASPAQLGRLGWATLDRQAQLYTLFLFAAAKSMLAQLTLLPVVAVAAHLSLLPQMAPPSWPAQWNLTLSTTVFPHWGPAGTHNWSMWLPSHPWGLVQLDGSVGQALCCWTAAHNGTCEATQAENARLIKEASPSTRVFSYHNMLLALGCFESQRDAMYDPALASYFLQFENGTIYNNPTYSMGGGGGDPVQPGEDQYLWNYTNPAVSEWVVARYTQALSMSGDALDGSFVDDIWFPEEHPQVVSALNMSAAAVAAEAAAQAAAYSTLLASLQAANKSVYRAFVEPGAGIHWNGTDTAQCSQYLRAFCVPDWQTQAILLPISYIANTTMSIASFLLARGPIAYVGFGWPSDDFDWRPEFEWDVGVPSALCTEAPPNRFSRPYTYGDVFIDCNDFSFSVPHQ